MQKREKVRYVFTSSNTRWGFHTFIPQLLAGLRCLFILESPSGSISAGFIRQLGEEILERGLCAEFWISAFDPLNPEGVLIPELETAIVGSCLLGTAAHDHIPEIHHIDLTIGEKHSVMTAKGDIIADLNKQIYQCNREAAQYLQTAGQYTDSIKQKAAAHINQEKIKNLTGDLIEHIFNSAGKEKHYFASAMTAEGMINYIDTLSHACRKRYFFTGPAGSGKSAILETIAAEARKLSLVVEYYYSGFDAHRLKALIIPNFQIALVDAGTLAVNLRPGDEIIDSTQYLDDYDLQRYEAEIMKSQRQCEALLRDAQQKLEDAQLRLSQLKRIYETATDHDKMEELKQGILAGINRSWSE